MEPRVVLAIGRRGTRVRRGLGVVLLPLLLLACAANEASPPPSAGTGTTVAVGACAWASKADKATLNVAYPDTAATYWSTSYALAPGERLQLRGRYPDAR